MTSLALGLKLSAIKTLSAVQRAINILKSAGPGAWYDPSDLTTLYQDSAGTTPVTAVEQPVGLMLDKSQGLVLGAELVTNGDFSSATGWSLGIGWSISGGVATKVAGVGDNLSTAILPPGTGAGKYFSITLTATVTAGSLAVSPGGYQATTAITASGTYTLKVFTWSPASNHILYVIADAAFAGTVDNISVRELPGNHLIQPTATSRPTLSSRYNLLTKTEQFDDGVWFKGGYGGGLPPAVIANDASGPASDGFADKVTFSAGAGAQSILFATVGFSPAVYRGVLCLKAASPGDVGKIIGLRHASAGAYLLITLTADYQVISRNETSPTAWVGSLDMALRPDVGTSSGEVSIHLAYASLTLAADASLPYQRINTATDYDSDFAKFPPYLKFDGVDDSLYSAASVDFTSTDKMTVFAGVHKASDAALGMFLEYGNGGTDSFQVVQVQIPGSNPTTQKVITSTQGTAAAYVIADSADYSAPKTLVYSAVMDIAGDSLVVRLNSAQVGSSSADQGTGNYGNKPLYIGRRNNASFPFSGRIYQLAIKGKSLSAGEVSTLESYVNSKTKAF